ncbi:MAG TPA: hypothetical protein VH496_14250 [Mycobacterium sp.]
MRRLRSAIVVGAVLALSACSAPGAKLEADDPVAVLNIAAAIHEPVYSFDTDTLLGLTDDNRVASIDVDGPSGANAHMSFSQPLAGVGRNIQVSPGDSGVALVPQPALGRVAALRIDGLAQIGDFPAGDHPSYLSQDTGGEYLLALSADRSTVTAVDLHRNDVVGSQPVVATVESTIEGSRRGRAIEFHVVGPNGVAYYKGHGMPAEKRGEINIAVADAVSDPTKVTRAYLAEKGTDRLVAVDTKRGSSEGLEVVGEASVGGPIRRIAVDDTRIYAATDTKLVVLKTNAFGGYPHQQIPIIATFDYRGELRSSPAGSAPLSGIAAGRHHVFLTPDGAPYVIRVAKPHV